MALVQTSSVHGCNHVVGNLGSHVVRPRPAEQVLLLQECCEVCMCVGACMHNVTSLTKRPVGQKKVNSTCLVARLSPISIRINHHMAVAT